MRIICIRNGLDIRSIICNFADTKKSSFTAMIKIMLGALVASLTLLSACSNTIPQTPTPEGRQDIVLTRTQQEFVTKGNGFAMNLVQKLDQEYTGKSFVCSPLSIQFALGMVNTGAVGETSGEITEMLGFGDADAAAINEYAKVLTDALTTVDNTTRMDIANLLVHNSHGVPAGKTLLKAPFTSALESSYKAGIEAFDFMKDNTATLRRINSWCAQKTEGMIPEILKEVKPDALAYFLNAIYFKGIWRQKFTAQQTSPQAFTREDGTTVQVDMMHQTADFGYGEDKICKRLTMPYGNGAFRLTAFLPNAGCSVSDVIASLDGNSIREQIGHQYEETVTVAFPKFETSSTLPLNDVLEALGMKRAFVSGLADFTAMSDWADCISLVLQKARIKLDEEGTEAAAVTVVEMMKATAVGPSDPLVFIADHPFFYVISEISTGAILFAGIYTGD